ncbi:PREDICTED: uncharacterized protein LOC105956239 [Erythranthe guttata]|uniref:uncharacterized protein LOC105956239 n=1 Tax=Erythranthe guttata TaxID=4155 RepID=UPI00064E0175|nr:PREDICTED: uncharacterized protein LOC105956239 [Erythranthe guttata]|eukprot:XP_012835541.1 PREDICTED: uncharacterized protein LOC105956239 [Erythranthe guttata]
MEDKLYCIVLNYFGSKVKLSGVDPDVYNYIDLGLDVVESFPSIEVSGLRYSCTIDGGEVMEIKNNNDVMMNMFKRNTKNDWFDLFVESPVSMAAEVSIEENEEAANVDEGDLSACIEEIVQFIETEIADEAQQDEPNVDVPVEEHDGRDDAIDDSDDDFIAHIDEDDNRSEIELSDAEEYEDDFLSDYESDDHCEAANNSDEEFDNDPLNGCMEFGDHVYTHREGDQIVLKKGQVFDNVDAFRLALKDYVIQEEFECVRKKNERKMVTAHCSVKKCSWRIHASVLPDNVTFQIKTYTDTHNCVRTSADKEVTAKWMASKLIDVLRSNPDLNLKGIEDEIKKYGVSTYYIQMYRAKMLAMEEIQGNHAELFQKLPTYAYMVQQSNPRSVVTLQCDIANDENPSIPRGPTFKRFFLGLAAVRDGFMDGCSPFLGFDGCHLKGPYGGVLLSAIGLDANNGLYPIAFAIVETESKESWGFFFHNLCIMFDGFSDGRPWTFMTDRQKGQVEAITERVPHAINRKCARHICANFRSSFAGVPLKKWFWKAARSYTAPGFNFAMYKIKEHNIRAYNWLLKIPSELWSRYAYDRRLKNDHVTNNISESFNNWIAELRLKPFFHLLDGLRAKLMNRLIMRREKGIRWKTDLPKNVVIRLNKERLEARKCRFFVAGDNEFQVQEDNQLFIVKLSSRTCECQVWDLSGIPCNHAILGILYRRENIEDYVHNSLSKQQYLTTYSRHIHAITSSELWPEDTTVTPQNLLPPTYRRPPGRPKKNRRRAPNEGETAKRSSVVRCKRCNGLGHNIRTCKGAPRSFGVEANVEGDSQFQASNNPEAEIPLSQAAESR